MIPFLSRAPFTQVMTQDYGNALLLEAFKAGAAIMTDDSGR
jgi:hypothetical protein